MNSLSLFRNLPIKQKIVISFLLLLILIFFDFFAINTFNNILNAKDKIDLFIAIFVGLLVPLAILGAFEVLFWAFSFVVRIFHSASRSPSAAVASEKVEIWFKALLSKIYSDIGSIEGKMHRMLFIIYSCIGLISIAPFTSYALEILFFGPIDGFSLTVLFFCFSFVITIGYFFNIIPIAKRTRSLGLNPWIALAIIIPMINFPFLVLLIFAPEGSLKRINS